MKTCCRCKQPKEPAAFHKDRSRADGRAPVCRACIKPISAEYHLRAAYGIRSRDFERMIAEQGNACAICKEPVDRWCVDHDHKTGKVRALLCNYCNVAIGQLKDSARLAIAVADYLIKHGNL